MTNNILDHNQRSLIIEIRRTDILNIDRPADTFDAHTRANLCAYRALDQLILETS